ncbi:MAG TPA: DNA polymerase III subunit epsilon [Steroidobacteraceae bacterium]|nr:DNA polymerase III subunit epsilon [Steroidobacteraceae bacterium]
MRQIVLDVETTGLEAAAGHRIIEIGCVEILNRRPTGQKFHRYLNPERDIDAGALAVHGIDSARLQQAPKFAEVADELLAFISGAELIIHNAPFDVGFLNAEFARLTGDVRIVANLCKVLDTLALARSLHPGQRNSLDALCKRYSVDNTKRELHGALLDAGILVDVYLAMTGGQSALALDMSGGRGQDARTIGVMAPARAPGVALTVISADTEELRQHEAMLDLIHKSSGGKTVWRVAASPDDLDGRLQ